MHFALAVFFLFNNPFRQKTAGLLESFYIGWRFLQNFALGLFGSSMLILFLASVFIIPNVKGISPRLRSIVPKLVLAYIVVFFVAWFISALSDGLFSVE